MTMGTLFVFLLQFRWFQIEVLHAMEKNVKLDEEYIEVGLPRGKDVLPWEVNLEGCLS